MKKTKENNLKKLKLLITIMPHNKRSLFMNIIEQYDCNYHLSFQGMGVATNEIKDMLGLKDTHRDVLFSIIREDKVKDCLLEIEDKVGLYKSGGIVKKHVMLIGLMIGVALSLVLSIIRIIYHFDIMYYLVPGFLICLLLSFFVPKVYVAIAFDSGGVAAGAMTSSFMLPLAIGVCVVLQGESQVLTDAFGIVAMVALTPIMVIELIGLIAIIRDKLIMKKQVSNMILEEDEVIIKF